MGKKIKEAESFVPPTEKEIMMIQPNNVTFGQYSITDWQENILTLISDKIQAHMTRAVELPRDLFNQPYVTIACDDAGGRNNKSKVIREAINLKEKSFSFRWIHPVMKRDIETTGSIITTVHDIKGTNEITININPWAIPFLVYYGVGVGGTRFSKQLALSLRGNYTKRIYKILCSQRDKTEYLYNIEQFRKDFEVPENYTNSQIERRILEPAKDKIKQSNSDVNFDYKLICRYPIPKRKPKADTIVFKIINPHPLSAGGDQAHKYQYAFKWIERIMDHPSDDRAFRAIEKITAEGHLNRFYEKCTYYDDQLYNGNLTSQHVYNILSKILKEDYKITFE